MNLPATPITDIKLTKKDLVLSTQGRSFWILDNLTPLHQLNDRVTSSQTYLFEPRPAIRTSGRGGGGPSGGRSGVQYPLAGAQIDYYLAAAPSAEITLEILDDSGKLVRKFSSAGTGATTVDDTAVDAGGGGDDEEGGGGFRGRGGPTRLDKTAGLHRFTWDLRYPGPWMSAARPEGPNGPMAVPGNFTLRLTNGTTTLTQPLTLIEDPRVTKSGVNISQLREQFEHNLRVRELVSDANKTVARVRAAQNSLKDPSGGAGDKLTKVNEAASHLITPAIRYSKPELVTHITYLYGMTTATDQQVGRDAIERYQALRKQLDEYIAELNKVLQ